MRFDGGFAQGKEFAKVLKLDSKIVIQPGCQPGMVCLLCRLILKWKTPATTIISRKSCLQDSTAFDRVGHHEASLDLLEETNLSAVETLEVLLLAPFLGGLGVFLAPSAEAIVDPLAAAFLWNLCQLGPLEGAEGIGFDPGVED